MIKLARSSFCHKPKSNSPEEMQKGADLRGRIEAICLEFPCYGYRRVTEALKREGLRVNHKKVLKLMKGSDLLCQVKHRWKKTTDSKHHFPRYPNLIKGMTIARLNQVWVSAITYIRIRRGFVYLAAILLNQENDRLPCQILLTLLIQPSDAVHQFTIFMVTLLYCH